jgi:hypothetical protein
MRRRGAGWMLCCAVDGCLVRAAPDCFGGVEINFLPTLTASLSQIRVPKLTNASSLNIVCCFPHLFSDLIPFPSFKTHNILFQLYFNVYIHF